MKTNFIIRIVIEFTLTHLARLLGLLSVELLNDQILFKKFTRRRFHEYTKENYFKI